MQQSAGISRGKIKKPVFMIIYGLDGCGKTTFAAEAPGSINLGPEEGSNEIDTARFENIKSFSDVRKAVHRLINEDMGFETLALDSLDWMEASMWKEQCKLQGKESIQDTFGSYGKWVDGTNTIWYDFIADLKILREKRNMNIIAIAHSQVKKFDDPSHPAPYDRYQLKLAEKAAAIWREAVECILFANFEVMTKKENKNDKKAKAYGDGNRVVYTERRPSFDAKNRYGLPFELPLGWSHFHNARLAGTPDSLEQVLKDIAELIANPKIAEKRAAIDAAVIKSSGDVSALVKIRNHARVLVGDQ